MKVITYNVLDYNEFDALVQQHLGIKEFECVSEFEWNNDCSYKHEDVRNSPNFNNYKPETPREQIEAWYMNAIYGVDAYIAKEEDRYGVGPYQILQWLCHKGHIQPGNYLITVSW